MIAGPAAPGVGPSRYQLACMGVPTGGTATVRSGLSPSGTRLDAALMESIRSSVGAAASSGATGATGSPVTSGELRFGPFAVAHGPAATPQPARPATSKPAPSVTASLRACRPSAELSALFRLNGVTVLSGYTAGLIAAPPAGTARYPHRPPPVSGAPSGYTDTCSPPSGEPSSLSPSEPPPPPSWSRLTNNDSSSVWSPQRTRTVCSPESASSLTCVLPL